MTDEDQGWYGPDSATFGDRLAAAREEAGLTQGKLAKHLGIRVSTLRGWEEDRSEPRANRLSMIAGILNVSIMWLLTGEGNGVTPEGTTPTAVPDASVQAALPEVQALRGELIRALERLDRLETALGLTGGGQ